MSSTCLRSMPYLRHLTALILIAASLSTAAFGQSCYQAASDSQLTVSGSATVRSFSCVSSEIHGRAIMERTYFDSPVVELRVPVRSFNCGKRAMNNDLYEALKADQHPFIQYRVRQANLVSSDQSGDRQIRVVGALSMAGTTHPDTTVVQGRPVPGQTFQIQGSTPLSLRRFGVEPPTALFGLIQVQDSVTVSVNLQGATCSASG